MTLIVGRKLNELTYLIADTASSVPKTREKFAPITNPICKLVVCSDSVVGYSGETAFLPNIIDLRIAAKDLRTFSNRLTEIHCEAHKKIDFLIIDLGTRALSKISNGKADVVDASYIGYHPAFERLQDERRKAGGEGTSMGMTLLPECPDEQATVYASDLAAFNRTLEAEGGEVGGFAVPFFVDTKKHMFGIYAMSARRPLAWHELSSGLARPVNWQGAEEGAFSINFAGNSHGFACHIRQCNLGIESNYRELGVETKRYKEPEWTFVRRMKKSRGIGMTMTVQRHPIDYIIGALMLRKKNRHADAIDEITACIDMILAACTDLEDKKIELHCRSLAAMFERYAEVQIPIEYVGYLMQSVRLRYEFLATQGAREEVERALRDFEIMQRAAAGKVRWSRRNPNDESSRA